MTDDTIPGQVGRIRLHIDPLLVTEELSRIPAELAFVSARLAVAEEAFLRAEHDAEVTEAQCYLMARAEGIGAAKTTEAQLKATVVTMPQVMESRAAAISARAARDRAKSLFLAVQSKLHAVQSIAANVRAEWGATGHFNGQSTSRAPRASVAPAPEPVAESPRAAENEPDSF